VTLQSISRLTMACALNGAPAIVLRRAIGIAAAALAIEQQRWW
jgi:hypothetical protein